MSSDPRDPVVPTPPERTSEVVLAEYDPAWPRRYEGWRDRILAACGDLIAEIHHIGSTAVPGLLAKPVIDIMPGLAQFEDGFALVEPLQALGFDSRGEFGIAGRHYFSRADVHVHVYAVGESNWHSQLAFRDALRQSEDARKAYAALKRELQQRHRFDRPAYTEAKSEFVTTILDRVRAER